MKNPDISSLEHTSWRCQYHVVFAPKYRRMESYREIRADIGVILRKLCQQKGVEIKMRVRIIFTCLSVFRQSIVCRRLWGI